MKIVEISFIVPAKNEEKHIKTCISSIVNVVGNRISYEIIVCDNGSVDNTVLCAENAGAKVFSFPGVNISCLRNNGAQKAKGSILVFLDADVALLPDWIGAFLEDNNKILALDIITGSRCLVPDNSSWIEKYWFAPMAADDNVTYINSGHLVVNYEFFERIGGFNTDLETGEDYEFCIRAIKKGGRVLVNNQLKVIHFGYPKSIVQFVKREAWHGKSDFESIRNIIYSKVSLLTIVYLLAHVLFFINIMRPFSLLHCVIVFCVCFFSSCVKFKKTIKVIPINTVIYYFYFLGRSIAFWQVVTRKCIGSTIMRPFICAHYW